MSGSDPAQVSHRREVFGKALTATKPEHVATTQAQLERIAPWLQYAFELRRIALLTAAETADADKQRQLLAQSRQLTELSEELKQMSKIP